MAKEINTQLIAVKHDRLHEDIKAEVSTFEGIAQDKHGIRLIFNDDVTQTDISKALQIAAVHDPAAKSSIELKNERLKERAKPITDAQIDALKNSDLGDIIKSMMARLEILEQGRKSK